MSSAINCQQENQNFIFLRKNWLSTIKYRKPARDEILQIIHEFVMELRLVYYKKRDLLK